MLGVHLVLVGSRVGVYRVGLRVLLVLVVVDEGPTGAEVLELRVGDHHMASVGIQLNEAIELIEEVLKDTVVDRESRRGR